MLGILRLVLALLVAVSHTGVQLGGLNPGVVAVVGFYLISGYVMAGLISRHYRTPQKAPVFYLDRALRLLPQYLFYATITLLWSFYSGAKTAFLQAPLQASDLFNNLFIVPLNYYMFNGSDQFTLIPPAWSLGAEIQFYLLAPFILITPLRLAAFGLISVAVYLAACVGLIHTEWYAYRLLPGVLLFFILGAYLQHCHQRQWRWAALAAVIGTVGLAATTLAILQSMARLNQPYNLETLLGLISGLLMLQMLATMPRKPWDDLAGDLSYGVFLNHFLILWTIYPQGVSLASMPGFITLCLVASWLTQRWVESPILKLRYRLRAPKLVN